MDFLRRVEGTVCEQLKKNTESHAFDGKLFTKVIMTKSSRKSETKM